MFGILCKWEIRSVFYSPTKIGTRRCTSNTKKTINNFSQFDLDEITNRLKIHPRRRIKNKKRAGVLIPLCFDTSLQPSILLTERSHLVGTHKVRKLEKQPSKNIQGQISFPGGILEESDEDIIACALRYLKIHFA
jgi:hypothetical protein